MLCTKMKKLIIGGYEFEFNKKAYDRRIIYAGLMGYDNEQLYDLSKRLINENKDDNRKAKFTEK